MGNDTNGGVVLDDADVDSLTEAVRAVWDASRGDSNDAEIDAGHDLAGRVAALLGMSEDDYA